MENEEEMVVLPHVEEVERPQSVSTDMVDLLVMVVDDLCVQVGELKEKMAHDKN
ncbi:TPA: hypothetical protein ACGPAZ_000253 [Streptococcus suis]